MTYINLIHRIKTMAGAREDESQDALEVVVENVAANLTDYTRRGFAERLPRELREAAPGHAEQPAISNGPAGLDHGSHR